MEWHSQPNLCENPILGAILGATLGESELVGRQNFSPNSRSAFSKLGWFPRARMVITSNDQTMPRQSTDNSQTMSGQLMDYCQTITTQAKCLAGSKVRVNSLGRSAEIQAILDGPNRKSPIASVQRTRSALAGHSASPRGTNTAPTNAHRAIRIAVQRTQGLRGPNSCFYGEI